jgi:hypothetical protein
MYTSSGVISYSVLGFFILTLIIGLWAKKSDQPLIAIVHRWLRWISFSMVIALFIHEWELSEKPFWILSLTAFLGWFLLETIYNWIVIRAISRSEIPLFPHFYINYQGEQWPVDIYFLNIKDWIRKNGFRVVQSLKAALEDNIDIRSNVFQNMENTIRLQILFIPNKGLTRTVSFNFTSLTASDHRYITDNLTIPFGGYYPENWLIVRKPTIRKIENLYQLHLERLKDNKEVFITWDNSVLEDVNYQQTLLEKENVENGFLYPKSEFEEKGRFTSEGCYRIWKQMWFMKYLGVFIQS